MHPIGSAVAIDCSYHSILVTAGHCCYLDTKCTRLIRNNLFCTESMSKDLNGNFTVTSPVVIPVKTLYAKKIPDFGILKRTDSQTFNRMIPICKKEDIPGIKDPSDWECRVKGYHCPVDVFKISYRTYYLYIYIASANVI